ncbi:MAG: molybdopterin biosynthesis protein MoeA [Synergistaceae bacterium]|nr:molybdopterin biosynthesis protein MoeA [Synergistaceae bacterium]
MVKKTKYPEHCSLDDAARILINEFSGKDVKRETMAPFGALGLVLADDVESRRNVPHYAASAVDGYALMSRLTSGATAATPVTLREPDFAWVNTGMPISGADSVVMVEDTSREELPDSPRGIRIYKSLVQGENVRAVGEDVMKGQLLACRGETVTPALVSLFLSAGIGEVSAVQRPRAVFIPTGNEIMPPGRWLSGEQVEAGFVVDSNSAYAAAAFKRWGYEMTVAPILPDDPEVISDAVARAAEEYDIVLLSAGSAKGSRDHSAEIFEKLGRMLFRYVRMKPGRPAMAASINGKPVICVPGFPMSCVVTLWSLVYPLLKVMSGESALPEMGDYARDAMGSLGLLEAELMTNHSSPAGVGEWLRVKCAEVGGKTLCWPLSSGASVLRALAESDGIARVSEESLEMPKGTSITVMLTRKIGLPLRLLFQGSDDPAFALLVSLVSQRGGELVIRAVGSMGGLAALGRDEAHLAAAHLMDAANGEYNTSYINQFAKGRNWRRTLIFHREQGIMTAGGNPKGVTSFEDLASGRVTFENRQPGAGTRVLLDYMLKEKGISVSDVPGYGRISITHLEAANKVASGVADATLGIKAAADALGLHFIPVAREPYELVFSENFDEHPAARLLTDAIGSAEWRGMVSRMGGYQLPGMDSADGNGRGIAR